MDKVSQNSNADTVSAKPSHNTQGILVLGMHRSGTSAATRVLNLLGCTLSDQLLGEHLGNETGHWEAFEAISLNDDILSSAGSSHDDWGPINPDWRQSAICSQMVRQVSEILGQHAALGPLFAIKDPRMCRLADVWTQAADKAQIEPLILMMLRNPAEVAASLQARDLMSTGYAELLWLRHVLDAEFYTRGRKRVVCTYDQLMGNWQGMVANVRQYLGVTFPRNTPKVHAEISNFLSQSQRHHSVDPKMVLDNPGYSHWLRETFRIILEWSETGENRDQYAILDEIRAEMDRAYAAFAKLLLPREFTGEVGAGGHLRSELASLQEELSQKATELHNAIAASEEIRAESLQSENDLAELNARLANAQEALTQANAAADTERHQRTETEQRLAELSRSLQEEQLRNAELKGQQSASQSALIQRQEELAQLLTQLREAERDQAHAEMLTQDLDRLKAQVQAHEDAALKARKENSDLTEENDRLSQKVLQLTEARDAADSARAASDQKLGARFDEIARLTAMMAEESGRAKSAANDADWLNSMLLQAQRFPKWWALMPQSWRRKREQERYMRAGLFDGQAYLNIYPDVAAHKMDPVRHYIMHGMAEGRRRPQ